MSAHAVTVTLEIDNKCKDGEQHEFLLLYVQYPSIGIALLQYVLTHRETHSTL
jgi:hypothetical protein